MRPSRNDWNLDAPVLHPLRVFGAGSSHSLIVTSAEGTMVRVLRASERRRERPDDTSAPLLLPALPEGTYEVRATEAKATVTVRGPTDVTLVAAER